MKRFAALAVITTVASMIWWMWPTPKSEVTSAVQPIQTKKVQPVHVSEAPPKAAGAMLLPALHTNAQSFHLAEELNAPNGDAAHDVFVLHQILTLYQKALGSRQGIPIGNDSDLARAFSGRNPMHQFFIAPDHPAMGVKGHIVDRWGTPYQLHPRGYGAFEVRSAGPDRKLYTADDAVANAPPMGEK